MRLPPKESFSRQQTMGLREAMAAALVRLLQDARFPGPGGYGNIELAVAYAEWPSATDEYVAPAACVLPGAGEDVDGHLQPFLLEDTWEPAGMPGWGLYVLSDYEAEFEVRMRAASAAERNALVMGFEQLFVQDTEQMLIAPPKGNRHGLLLDLPEYFQSQARFALKSTLFVDDPDTAMAEAREVVFTLSAQAKKMRVGLVQPFTLKLVVETDDEADVPPTQP